MDSVNGPEKSNDDVNSLCFPLPNPSLQVSTQVA